MLFSPYCFISEALDFTIIVLKNNQKSYVPYISDIYYFYSLLYLNPLSFRFQILTYFTYLGNKDFYGDKKVIDCPQKQ